MMFLDDCGVLVLAEPFSFLFLVGCKTVSGAEAYERVMPWAHKTVTVVKGTQDREHSRENFEIQQSFSSRGFSGQEEVDSWLGCDDRALTDSCGGCWHNRICFSERKGSCLKKSACQ